VGAQNLVQVAYLLGRKVSVVLVALFSCLLEKIFPSDRYFIGGGWNSGCSECVCLRGLVGRLDFASVLLVCEQASSTDAFLISYKSLR
jgi:hypothetical protein